MTVNNCASLSFLLVTKAKQQSKFGNEKNRSAWSVHRLKYTNFNVKCMLTVSKQYARYVVVIMYTSIENTMTHDTLATVMKNDGVSQI